MMQKQEVNGIVERAMAALEQEFGSDYVVSRQRGTYGETHFDFKVRFVGAGAKTPEAIDFERYAELEGLKADDLGTSFDFRNDTYTIVGYRTKARKRPISCERSDGKVFVFDGPSIVRLLGRGTSIRDEIREATR